MRFVRFVLQGTMRAPGRGMGFCIFNNIAIAARYAHEKARRLDES